MKIAIAIAAQDALPHLLFPGRLEEGIATVVGMGYDGVELSIRDPSRLDRDRIGGLMARHSLEVAAVGTGLACTMDRLSFSDEDASVRLAAVQRIKSHIDFASFFQSKVFIGYIKGSLSPESAIRKVQKRWITSCLKECAQFAAKRKVTLLIEIINRFESSFLHTIGEGVRFLKEMGEENIKLLIDTFHMNIEESSNEQAILEGSGHIDYVHLADNNRMYPGAGQIDFSKVISGLRRIGYQGYLTAEIVPKPSDEVAARRSIKAIKHVLAST